MRKHIGSLTCAAIFCLAAALRIYTFVFPHNHGDQIIYAALAQNIAENNSYNLLSTEIVKTNISGYSFFSYNHCEKNSPRSIANLFKKGGADLYSDNLFYRPPLFPFTIRLLSFNRQILSFAINNLFRAQNVSWKSCRLKPYGKYFELWLKKQTVDNLFLIATKQLPVTFPSFLGSLLIFAGVIYLANSFSKTAAVWAALIAAFAPVDIFCATRVLSDSMMTGFLLWSFIFAVKCQGKKSFFLSLPLILAAVYTKESAAVICSASFFIIAIKNKKAKKFLFLSAFSFACFIPWLIILFLKNGSHLSVVYHHAPLRAYWYTGAFSRNYFFHFYFPFYLYPVLLFSIVYYFSAFTQKDFRRNFLVVVPIATLIIITILQQKECRQILPAYPFLYVSAALGLEKFREKINARFQPAAGFVIILLIILMSAYHAFMKISPSLFGNAGGIFLT